MFLEHWVCCQQLSDKDICMISTNTVYWHFMNIIEFYGNLIMLWKFVGNLIIYHYTYGFPVCLYSSWCVFPFHEFMSHQCPCRCVLWIQFECTLEVGDRLLMLVIKAVVIPCKISVFSKTQCYLFDGKHLQEKRLGPRRWLRPITHNNCQGWVCFMVILINLPVVDKCKVTSL